MTTAHGPDVVVFGTEETRRQSRARFLLLMKLLLVPFLAAHGVHLGRHAPRRRAARGGLCGLLRVARPGFALVRVTRDQPPPPVLVRAGPEGVACGPGRFGWVAPYGEVSLIQQSHEQDVQEPYLEVTAGARSAKVLMDADTAQGVCPHAMADRCPCAIRIDEAGREHPPAVLQTDPGSELAGKAVRNLGLLRSRYLRATQMFAACFLVSVAGLAFVGLARSGVIQADPGLTRGLTVSSLFFAALFGVCGVLQFGQYRSWDRYCRTFTEGAGATSHGA